MKTLLLFLSLFSTYCFAEDVTVFYKKGYVVKLDSEGVETQLKKGDSLIEGESIKTGGGAFAILKIGNHSTHRVEEKSEILIEKLPYTFEESEELQQGAGFFLKMGTVFSNIVKKADEESFQVKTRNTTMGVRGTELMASIDPDSQDTWLTVNEGTVEVSNGLSKSDDLVEHGKTMVIEKDKNFTQQKRYDFQEKLSWDLDQKKEKFKSFRQQRKFAYKEFRQKRSSWTRNESRWKEFKNKRKARIEKFRERVKKLKGSKKLEQRRQLRAKLKEKVQSIRAKRKATVQELKEKKTFHRKGLLDSQDNESFQPNSFMNRRKKRKKKLLEQSKDKRINNFQQRRQNIRNRRLERKTP